MRDVRRPAAKYRGEYQEVPATKGYTLNTEAFKNLKQRLNPQENIYHILPVPIVNFSHI